MSSSMTFERLPNSFFDGLGLSDKDLKYTVFNTLGEDKVVATDHVSRLQLAVDAAVALLDAARVPRQIEVEEVRTVSLEIEAFAGGIGGEQDAQRVLCWIGVEPTLNLLTATPSRQAVDNFNPLLRSVSALDGLLED